MNDISSALSLDLVARQGRWGFRVHVAPRGRTTEVLDVRMGAVRVRVAAPPHKGAANRALIEFLSDRLAVRPSSVTIEAGERSRDKLMTVEGLSREELAGRLRRWLSDEGLLGSTAIVKDTPSDE